GRLQLDCEPLRHAEWIAKVMTYRTDAGGWQVASEECNNLCVQLLREINSAAVLEALGNLAAAAWTGLCKETNYLRDVFPDAHADAARGLFIRTRGSSAE